MALLHSVMVVFHLLFAGAWTGSVVFVTWAVLPTARAGDVQARPLSSMVDRLVNLSRLSAVVMLVSGGVLAGELGGGLTSTTEGWLVVAMVVLWLALTALVEVGASRLADGLDGDDVRSAAQRTTTLFQAAGVVALLLLVDAGLVAAAA